MTTVKKEVIRTNKRRYHNGCFECGEPFTAPEWTYWEISRPGACEINTTGEVSRYEEIYTPIDEDWHVCYRCSYGEGHGTPDFPEKTFLGVTSKSQFQHFILLSSYIQGRDSSR